MSSVRVYSGELVDVMAEDSLAVVRNKRQDKYFQVHASRLPEEIRCRLHEYQAKVGASFTATLLTACLALIVLNVVGLLRAPAITSVALFTAILVSYAVVSVGIHELAHVVCMRHFGKDVDRAGFKMHYVVFPAFYVRMNQSLLLPKHERIAVHSAGIAANLLMNTAVLGINTLFLRSGELALSLRMVFVSVLINCFPFLNSDGYRVLLALRSTNEVKGRKGNPAWIRMLKLSSAFIAIWYTWTWVSPIVEHS